MEQRPNRASCKAPVQLMGKNGEHRKTVDAKEQKVCQKNRKAEKMQQVGYKWVSKRARRRLKDKCAQTSGE